MWHDENSISTELKFEDLSILDAFIIINTVYRMGKESLDSFLEEGGSKFKYKNVDLIISLKIKESTDER